MPTTKYDCLLCKEKHSVKSEDYGKHLMKHHQETILLNSTFNEMTLKKAKANKIPYITITNNKTVIIPNDEAYMCLCCNMYYTKTAFATKHSHKEFNALEIHNQKMEQYLEKYESKVKYNINPTKDNTPIVKNQQLGYEVVYKLVPEASWTGTSKMVEVVDQIATERNRKEYEANLLASAAPQPKAEEPAAEKQPAAEPVGFPVDFMVKMLKQTFKELSVEKEDYLVSKRFENNIMGKFFNDEEITNETITEAKDEYETPIDAIELEEAERAIVQTICPKAMLKKLGMTYDELYQAIKS